jgi:hypothetical protein
MNFIQLAAEQIDVQISVGEKYGNSILSRRNQTIRTGESVKYTELYIDWDAGQCELSYNSACTAGIPGDAALRLVNRENIVDQWIHTKNLVRFNQTSACKLVWHYRRECYDDFQLASDSKQQCCSNQQKGLSTQKKETRNVGHRKHTDNQYYVIYQVYKIKH